MPAVFILGSSYKKHPVRNVPQASIPHPNASVIYSRPRRHSKRSLPMIRQVTLIHLGEGAEEGWFMKMMKKLIVS